MRTTFYRKHLFLISAAALCFGIFSCKKKETASSETPKGTLLLHFHSNADTNEVEAYDDTYLIAGGRKISVSNCQLYVSGIQLIKADGSFYNVPDVNLLVMQGVEEYEVGSVPAGNYMSINFNVGLAPSTDMASSSDSTLNKSSMWLDPAAPSAGHVFVSFEGKVDTSRAANGTKAQMQPFHYRIGTAAHLKTIYMPKQNYSVLPEQAQFVHITIDYAQLLSGIPLNDAANLQVTSKADNSGTLAGRVADNIPDMFSYEE